jgi:hypothetical protein
MAGENSLALMVRPPDFDMARPMMMAAQLRNMDTQNSLQQFQLSEGMERKNSLADFKMRTDAGDPNATNALTTQPDIFAQMVQARGQLDDQRRKTFDETLIRNAKGAQRIAGITDPAERQTAWTEELDAALKEKRIDESAYKRLSGSQPNDLLLNNIIKQGISVEQAIALEQKEKDRGVGMAAIGAVNAIAGGGTAAPPAAGGGTTDAAVPRGIRNNNPLNIEAGDFTKGQPGFAGSDGRFAKFSTPAQGIAAADKLLENYGKNQGINSVQGVINRWAPSTENNTGAYAEFVAKQLGVKPGDKIDLADPVVRSQLVAAMGHYENGKPISAARPLSVSLNPQAERLQAALPQLRALQMLPGIPESVAKGIGETIKNIEKESEPTSDMKEYRLYAKQTREAGNEPMPFLDWQSKLATDKATRVSQNVEAAGGKKIAEGLSRRYLAAQTESLDAASTVRLYESMDKLLDDPNVYTGTGGEAIASLKKAGTTLLGLNLKGVANAEVAGKITQEIAASFKAKASDPNTSNYERQIYEKMATGLSDSAAGRKLIVQMRVGDLSYQAEVAKVWREHLRENGDVDPKVDEALANLAAKRRERLGEFLTQAQEISGEAKQPAPTAGATDDPALKALVDKFKLDKKPDEVK